MYLVIYFHLIFFSTSMKSKVLIPSIILIVVAVAGILFFINKNNDHAECKDIVEQRVDSNGDTIISRKHICKEMFSF